MLFASANWKNWSTAPVEAPVWSAMLTWHLSHFSTIPPGLAEWQTFSVSVCRIVECSVTDLLNIKCRHAWSSQWCSWHLLSPSNQIPNANQLPSSYKIHSIYLHRYRNSIQPDSKCKSTAAPPLSYKIHTIHWNISWNQYNPSQEPSNQDKFAIWYCLGNISRVQKHCYHVFWTITLHVTS